MNYPTFFDEVKSIKLQDPLSNFLGAFEDGELEITYLDCVKLAGHSCPTVAGAYLMVLSGLAQLYPDGLPQRGGVKVEMRDSETNGVTGVVATVISFVVGASGDGGFKGIGGNMSRNNLLSYDSSITREVRLTRLDNGKSVEVDYDPSSVMPSPQMQPLMGKIMQKQASVEERVEFGRLWQERVEKILINEANWNNLITLSQ
jgi:formylmethanofuran dehydrogenase subunit E